MKLHTYKLLLTLWVFILSACSGGPAEKPVADSFSSPAKLLDQGIYQYNNNNYPKAIEHFEKALLQYRSIDNQAGIANSSMNLAKTYMATNHNQIAAGYLINANKIIKQAPLEALSEHLHILNSSLAIKNTLYDEALLELKPVLKSRNTTTQLAALKNRTAIAFANNESDQQQWLNKYKSLQQKHAEGTSSHLARILRFEAELANDAESKSKLLKQSLDISRKLAARTAIAATLSQWADIKVESEMFDDAEDKYLRALFIRHQLGDVTNTLLILKQLQEVYLATDNNKRIKTEEWINKVSNDVLDNWDKLFSVFETYPVDR